MASKSSVNVIEDTTIAPLPVCSESDDNDKEVEILQEESIHNMNTTRLLELLPEEVRSFVKKQNNSMCFYLTFGFHSHVLDLDTSTTTA